MKTVKFALDGVTYHLCLNGNALFQCYEHFLCGTEFIEKIAGNDREGFLATCWCLETFSQQGSVVRRWESDGCDKVPILPAQKAAALMRPEDVVRAREALRDAFTLGFAREEAREDEEIDLGLLELQKKSGKRISLAKYLQWCTQFLRLGVREGMLLPPGTVLDLMELEIDRRNLRKEGH